MDDSRFVAAAPRRSRADLPIGDLAPGDMGDLGREEITASPACRFRDAAAEFAALAVLADIVADGQVPVFAPERLKQTGGRPEPGIERFVDAMFLEDWAGMRGSWLMGFPNSGAMLRAPRDTKQILAMAAEIYRVRSDGQDF